MPLSHVHKGHSTWTVTAAVLAKKKKNFKNLGVVVCTFNPRMWEAEASLVYMASVLPAYTNVHTTHTHKTYRHKDTQKQVHIIMVK